MKRIQRTKLFPPGYARKSYEEERFHDSRDGAEEGGIMMISYSTAKQQCVSPSMKEVRVVNEEYDDLSLF